MLVVVTVYNWRKIYMIKSLDSALEKQKQEALAPAKETRPTEEIAVIAPTDGSVVVPEEDGENQSVSLGGIRAGTIAGKIELTDLIIPYLKVVQTSGSDAKRYNSGTVIVSDVVLAQPPPTPDKEGDPVHFTVLRGDIDYVEWKDFESGERGRIVKTADEVRALGGIVTDKNKVVGGWNRRLRCHVLVHQPDGAQEDLFPFKAPDGTGYLAAVLTLTKTSYYQAQIILTKQATVFKGVSYAWSWEMRVKKEAYGKVTVCVPKLTLYKPTSEETRAWMATL